MAVEVVVVVVDALGVHGADRADDVISRGGGAKFELLVLGLLAARARLRASHCVSGLGGDMGWETQRCGRGGRRRILGDAEIREAW